MLRAIRIFYPGYIFLALLSSEPSKISIKTLLTWVTSSQNSSIIGKYSLKKGG
jgi:hypothetical protein